VRSRTERSAGVDDDREEVAAASPRAGRPRVGSTCSETSSTARISPTWALKRPPRIGKALVTLRTASRGSGICEHVSALRTVDLLESLWEQLDHGRARLLETLVSHFDGDATEAQRNALFSLSKKLSSVR
jgi:hypothetical protein